MSEKGNKKVKIKSVSLKDNLRKDKVKIENLNETEKEKLDKEIGLEATKQKVVDEISELLKDVNINDFEIREKKIKEIGILLEAYNRQYRTKITDVLRQEFLQLSDLNRALLNDKNYIAFAFYFWNIDDMNFKIIGLTEVIPLLEVIETREIFYLDIPTMSTNGQPIFFLIRGFPISTKIKFDQKSKDMFEQFQIQEIKPDVLRALIDSEQFIGMFGKHKIPPRFILIVALVMILEFFVIFTIMKW